MEQLALFALPVNKDEEQEDQSSGEEDVDNESNDEESEIGMDQEMRSGDPKTVDFDLNSDHRRGRLSSLSERCPDPLCPGQVEFTKDMVSRIW